MLNKKITTEKRLSVRLYLSLFIYAVVGYGLVVLLDYIFSKSDNSILAWLHLRTDVIFIVYLIMGFVCIFNFFLEKAVGVSGRSYFPQHKLFMSKIITWWLYQTHLRSWRTS